jgi:uncharacterized protein DUF3300
MWIVLRRLASWLLATAFLASAGVQAQDAPPPPLFKPEELDQMLAPVALYPDALLMQVLMAATYPLDVVKAANWSKAHPDKKGDAAVQAVANETWDVSVKSLVAFPQILTTMSNKIEWTQKVGDAFLGQQKDVLDAVQRLRRQAQAAGHLSSNPQQTVSSQGQTIVIQPASPEVIYVPAYNPTVVYGAWAYPAYPPVYYPPPPAYYPGGALAAGFAWGVGVAAAGAIFSDCDWNNNDVNINVNRATNIDRNYVNTGNINTGNINRGNINTGDINRSSWQHNPQQRGGVAYRDPASRQRYAKDVPGAEARQQYRGRDAATQTAMAERPAGAGQRGDAARQPAQGRADASPAQRPSGAGQHEPTQARAGAFEGVGNGPQAQREAARGRASQQSWGGQRDGGGAAVGGGGRSGGARGGGGRR